uniref:Nucleoside-triphosphatase 2 n=1 Tax=Toxoplasma gondii TaxID=5811 RepID=UPI0002C865B0|nr:Chain A, Nucleoside-triphosphatase 2 [Toxoplasma gondii]4JEP_B Chain B, Nucleoside-triphosphatase 2 [Toxoplasma gondii]
MTDSSSLRGVDADTEKRINVGKTHLQTLRNLETRCHDSLQALVVIDAGSSSTRTNVFLAKTRSCPNKGRSIDPDSIQLIREGKRFTGLRVVLEEWLDTYAGKDWESRPVDARLLFQYVPQMHEGAKKLMQLLEEDTVAILDSQLNEEQKVQVKALGIPVMLCSTAGVRDFHEWYRDALFVLLRHLINNPSPAHGYKFFTNPFWTRPITGAEEGLFAFITLNHLSRRLGEDPARCMIDEYGVKHCRNDLAGVVEVGGASAQIVFPLQEGTVLPSSVRAVNLQRERLLPERYPSADVVSVSFMQLGMASSAGLFLKELCSNDEFLQGGICSNPCLFKGFQQSCSAGEVEVRPDGSASVNEDVRKNRLKPLATYCSVHNPEISFKVTNEMQCRENSIDPTKPLAERMKIENCSIIEGTGNFDKCVSQVESILVAPKLPLPANIEAASSGFESVDQVFRFASSTAPMFITGREMLASIDTLKDHRLLRSDFSGDVEELAEAAREFCSSEVIIRTDGPVIQLPNARGEQKLNSLNFDLCKTMALTVSLLRHMAAGENQPSFIKWEKSIAGPDGKPLADLGWQVGVILHHVLFTEEWGRTAYEAGYSHNLEHHHHHH